MKKVTALILVVLLLLLCACGGTASGTADTAVDGVAEDNSGGSSAIAQNEEAAAGPADEAEEAYQTIVFEEPIIICDDDTVKIEAVAFYEEYFNWSDKDPAVEKGISFRFQNKTDQEISIQLSEGYLNSESVSCILAGGDSTVAAGKTGTTNYIFQKYFINSTVALDSIEDLYLLEGKIDVRIWMDGSIETSYTVSFCFQDQFGGTENSAEASESYVFCIRDNINFGASMDEVASKEQRLDIDYEGVEQNGYIAAQAEGLHETVDFDGFEDANLFYHFNVQTELLEEVYVMFGYGDDVATAENTYHGLLERYSGQYGAPLDEAYLQYVPNQTVAYEHATTHYEDTQLKKHNKWICRDRDGYVIIDLASALIFGDSHYTFVGFKYVTEDEIMSAGGDLASIPVELISPQKTTTADASVAQGTVAGSALSGSAGASFTNRYGTATTVCAESGCNKYIASSGDTNCCVTHSNKCLECGCYIDGDAMYCMSCLSSSVNRTSSSSASTGSSGTSTSGGCQYKYPDGSLCGAKCTDYPSMCNTHFNSLNAIYEGLVGD